MAQSIPANTLADIVSLGEAVHKQIDVARQLSGEAKCRQQGVSSPSRDGYCASEMPNALWYGVQMWLKNDTILELCTRKSFILL